MSNSIFHAIAPGQPIPGDWFPGRIPTNIVVGENSVLDSSFCFKRFYSTQRIGLRIGSHVTFWRTSLAVEEHGYLEIGDYCYLANASLVCSERITIGSRVLIAGGVTIADSDFHPLAPAARLADTVALSPEGHRQRRPPVECRPVVVEDDVWIGYNATVLKGVRVGWIRCRRPAGSDVGPGLHCRLQGRRG